MKKKNHFSIFFNEVGKDFLRSLFYALFFPISFSLRLLGFRVIEHGPVIGNLCTQIDAYVKERKLGRIPQYKLIIHPHIFDFKKMRLTTANNYLYKLWKQHFYVVTNPWIALFFKFVFMAPWLQLRRPYFSVMPNESYFSVNKDYYTKFPEFSPKNSVLKIPSKDQKRGEQILEKWGIKQSDWFVCFFAREPGYYDQKDLTNQGVLRNVDVTTYKKSLLEVTKRGGYCIRMGSSKMAPLPEEIACLDRVIDYPKSEYVSDFMDVYLSSRCKFMLVCASGIAYLPGLFGNPIIITNHINPMEAIPLYSKDIGLYKGFYSKKLKRELSFFEIFSSFVAGRDLSYFFDSLHYSVSSNSEEEIYEATKEMLDRLDGNYTPPSEAEALRERFYAAVPNYLYAKDALGKMSDHFLKKNEHLL